MKNSCVDFYVSLERTYKSFLELIKHELDTIEAGDLTPVQAFIVLNIGNNDVSLSELVLKRGYSGSNASYNIKKMVSSGYIKQTPSPHDKRSLVLSLTDKGQKLFERLQNSMTGYAQKFERIVKDRVNYYRAIKFLREVDAYWRNALNEW